MRPLSPAIFKANDIRGIYGATLDDEIAELIALAIAAEARALGVSRIALGRDGRLSGAALTAAVAAGLRAGGMTVCDIGLVPTPALYYAAVTECGGNGIMITGSHNPKDYNGMKIMLAHDTLKGDGIRRLFTRIRDNTLPRQSGGSHEPLAVTDNYITCVNRANPLSRPLTVVVDAGNGATGNIAPALFTAMGCTVIPLFCEIDGNFPNHHPDPAQPENLHDAADRLAASSADVAVAFDGDGDRLGIVLPDVPPPIYADRLLMLFARDLLSRRRGERVVFDVKCSALLAAWVERHGGSADMQPTGHAFIKARMKETAALLGGEMSGHFYFREQWYGFDDALFAAARLLAILADTPDAFADIPDSVSSPELNVAMDGKDAHRFVAELNAHADFPQAKRIVTIDGLRVEYDDGFGLVRASNTTPALVLRFEATTEARLTEIKNDFRRLLLAVEEALKLPF